MVSDQVISLIGLEMENLERRVKDEEEMIARLRAETPNKAHEDDENIYVDLSGAGGSCHQRRRRRRDDLMKKTLVRLRCCKFSRMQN